jgi:hypothetical protein
MGAAEEFAPFDPAVALAMSSSEGYSLVPSLRATMSDEQWLDLQLLIYALSIRESSSGRGLCTTMPIREGETVLHMFGQVFRGAKAAIISRASRTLLDLRRLVLPLHPPEESKEEEEEPMVIVLTEADCAGFLVCSIADVHRLKTNVRICCSNSIRFGDLHAVRLVAMVNIKAGERLLLADDF